MKAVRHFFVTGIVLIGALVSADAADTQVRLASLTYSGTSGYTLVERSNLRRSINGRYVGLTTREVRSFISPSTSPRAEYDRSTNPLSRGRWYNGSFYVLEETKRNAKESGGGIHDSIPSIFNISPEGKLTMYQDNGYPSFRSFPAFTTDKISPGDSWRATAERAVDPLNKGIFTRLRMEVSYTFVGEERYQGQNVYRIKAMWQTNYGMLSYRDLHGDDTLVKALGGHKADIYVQKSTGATVMIIDNVDETFVYSDGTNVTLRGTINLFTETPPAIDTEKIIPALQRIASVSPDVMEDALAKADGGNGDETAAGNDNESDSAASDADSALAKANGSSGDDDTAAGNDRESDNAASDADSALAKADSSSGDDDTAAGNDRESGSTASDADSALVKADGSSGDDDTAAGKGNESDSAASDADSALAKADSSNGDETAAGHDRESDSAASDADSALAKANGSNGDETAAGHDRASGSTASDAGNALAKADGGNGDDETAAGHDRESDNAASNADSALAKANGSSGDDDTAAGHDSESGSTASDADSALAKADSSNGDETAAGHDRESGSAASDAGNALAKADSSSGDDDTAAGNDRESDNAASDADNALAKADGGNGEYGATSSIDNALASVQSAESPKNNIVVEKTNAGIRLSVRDIKFKADSAEMLPGENRRLDEIASVLKLAPESQQFLVEGHTAAVGKPNGEQRLSEQRARRIAQELEKRGVNTQSFICRGWGGTKPVASNATDAGRAQNRRVEITILQ